MICLKCIKNIDLLGNNFHTVIEKYSVKSDETLETFSENETRNNELGYMELKDKYNLISPKKEFSKKSIFKQKIIILGKKFHSRK
ncbi:hypothetical protein [Methanobrevibacter sp. UBA212]|uniref:hypothetical protein n=1 Tax=Methanobrevibacter sp. UBA212 TaxID=1915476 RepID=UPI0025E9EEAE|nr:hypothetical protein [Methanobrevibacter sp. UBA212]MEE1150652.1 hypothetical protein [Methanobrevibacter sp.]